jgi:twin BRCT domain
MNKQPSATTNKLRITCSNFENAKKEYIQGLVKKLGGSYEEHLEYDTHILIAANSLSSKHRVDYNYFKTLKLQLKI